MGIVQCSLDVYIEPLGTLQYVQCSLDKSDLWGHCNTYSVVWISQTYGDTEIQWSLDESDLWGH